MFPESGVTGGESGTVKMAFDMLAFISRESVYTSQDVMLQVYKMLARPHLEYCVRFWVPYCRKDAIKLE